MSSWKSSTLGTLCSIEIGRTPSRDNKAFWDELKKTTNIWLSIADLANAENKVVHDSREYLSDKGASICRKVKKGTLLLSFKLTLGRMAFAGIDLYTNEAIAALIPLGEEVSKEYLYFYLLAFNWDKACGGDVKVKGKTLNKTKLREIVIRYPPLPEQQRIVAMLDQIFEGIDAARVNTERNLSNTRNLFEEYLYQVFSVSNNGWAQKKIRDVIETTETINPTKKPDQEFIYIDVSSVDNTRFEIASVSVLKGSSAPSRARKLVRTGDVIFATVRPTLRRIAIIPRIYDGQVCSTGYFVLRPKNFISNKFLFYFLLSRGFMEKMKVLQKGASYPAVTDSEVKEQKILFPSSIEEQQDIVSRLELLHAKTDELEKTYQRKREGLEELRQAILQKTILGEM